MGSELEPVRLEGTGQGIGHSSVRASSVRFTLLHLVLGLGSIDIVAERHTGLEVALEMRESQGCIGFEAALELLR